MTPPFPGTRPLCPAPGLTTHPDLGSTEELGCRGMLSSRVSLERPPWDLPPAQEVALSPMARPLPCRSPFQGKLSPLPASPPPSGSFLPSSKPCPLLPTPHS